MFSKTYEHVMKNKIMFSSIFIISIIFICISIYFYNHYIKPIINASYVSNKEYIEKEQSNEVTIYLFYTEWCPYCKKAKPEWDTFKEKVENTNYSQTIIFREIDCDQEVNLAEKYNIEGYPTIKLIWRDNVYEYDAKPDHNRLIEFLEGSIK